MILDAKVNQIGHLTLREHRLPQANEWTPDNAVWVFLHVAEGEGYLLRTTNALCLSAGDTLVVAPQVPALLRASQLGDLRLHYFELQPRLLTGVLTPGELQQLELHLIHQPPAPKLLVSQDPMAQRFASLIRQATGPATMLVRCQLLELAASILSKDCAAPPDETEPIVTAQHRFARLASTLSETELLNRSPADLARQCGCGTRHFSRLFRKRFGQTLVAKKTELRLLQARELLRHTDAKVIDVAFDSGFQHVGLFNALFKRRFGATPSQVRRRHLARA